MEITSLLLKIKTKIKKRNLVILLVVIILTGTIYFFKNQFIVATVNGKPIWRLSLINELEKQAGKQILDSLITKTLILQEAKKQNVTVTSDEINKELERIEENLVSQGQDLDQVLGVQGINRDELREQIKIQKIIEKIVGRDISVTDEEVNEYLEENKDFLSEDSDIEEVKEGVKEQLRQQKIGEEVQVWLESLRGSAKINYFR